jgi:hypothetical protein
MFLKDFFDRGGPTMMPFGHFIPNPTLAGPQELQSDWSKVPLDTGSHVLIATIDPKRRELGARGFFCVEATPQVSLMWRQFSDGYLYTRPWPVDAAYPQ